MDFAQVEAAFEDLKGKYDSGLITEEEFKAQLEELMIQDEEGKWWIIGYETGQWYYHDGEGWVQGEPPLVEVKAPPKEARRPEPKREPEALPSPPARRPWGWVVAGVIGLAFLCHLTYPRPTPAPRVVEKPVTVVVEKRVLVTVEKEVPVEIVVEKEVMVEKPVKETVVVEKEVVVVEEVVKEVPVETVIEVEKVVEKEVTVVVEECGHDTTLVPSQWSIVLCDTFSTNVNHWFTGDYSGERLTGKRLVTDGKYRWETEALQGFVWYSYPRMDHFADFYLTVEAKRISGPEDATCGVIFRKDDGGNYYYFRTGDDQRYRFSLRYEDKWTTLADWTETSAIRPGDVNRLTVIAEGSHFSFYINDQYVGEADDSRLSSGKAGVVVQLHAGDDAVFEFDNFELRAP